MREIKFRGMDLQGRWFYGNLAILHKDLKSTGNKTGSYISNAAGAPFAYAIRPETVGEYTGLKDRNGTEIYEGDILVWEKFKEVQSVVSFREGMFLAGDMPLADCLDEEIVGNIYEQKENRPEAAQ